MPEWIALSRTRHADQHYLPRESYDPVGGSFGEGVAQLTAVRTILDDDGGSA